MKIGIDARLINETGVGRYIRNLIIHLAIIDQKNQYIVFLNSEGFTSFKLPNQRWQKKLVNIKWHTFAEQIIMPFVFYFSGCDLIHEPYYSIPIFYFGKQIVTIHDLTILTHATGKATTLPKFLYRLKLLAYKLILQIGLRECLYIIAVSETTKKQILQKYPFCQNKIIVTYEGIDQNFASESKERKVIISKPYFLYVGNAYPHKNLTNLIKAFEIFTEKRHDINMKLVLVGPKDYFYQLLQGQIEKKSIKSQIIFFGPADDASLASLYTHAVGFVFPSLSEGFGLPAIEAIFFRCPVICADIDIFRELFNHQVQFFDPHNPIDIADKLESTYLKPKIAQIQTINKYQWEITAQKTLKIYESCFSV